MALPLTLTVQSNDRRSLAARGCRLARSLACVFVLAFAPAALASEAWQDVLRFHGVDRVGEARLAQVLAELSAGDTELEALAAEAMRESAFGDRLIDLLAQRMQVRLSEESLAYYQQFMASPSGLRMAELVQQHSDPTQLNAAVRAEPAPHHANFIDFDRSDAAAEVLAFLSSAEVLDLGRDLGKDAGCQYFARALPREHEVMVALALCADAREGGRTQARPAGLRASVTVVRLLYSGEELRRQMSAVVGSGGVNADLKAVSQRALRDDFDVEAMEAGIADHLEAGLSPQHLDRLAAYARTESGQLVTRIVQTRGAASLSREVDRHPPHLMRGLNMLYESEAWKAAFERMRGDKIGPMVVAYTQRLVCDRARRDEADLFDRLVASGRCAASAQ